MKVKILLSILYSIIALTVAGCAAKTEDDSVVTNQSEMIDEVPADIYDMFCNVVSPEEKDFYDDFLFVSYDEEECIIELKAVIGDKELPIYYKYDREVEDFHVFNAR